MKRVALICQDDMLAQQWISRQRAGEQIVLFPALDKWEEAMTERRYDVVVVSDRLWQTRLFGETMERWQHEQDMAQWIVLLSDWHDPAINKQWQLDCEQYGVQVIPPHRTRDQVLLGLRQHIYGETPPRGKGTLVVFVGTTPNIGTTIASFACAVGLAEQTNCSVGYMCLNLKSSKLHLYMGQEKPDVSLDQLRAELRARSMRPDRLRATMTPVKRIPRLRVLYGNRLREQAEYVTPDDVEYLLHLARQAFDICILEVNAYWDNAATICALLHADCRIVVSTSELAHFQEDANRWLHALCPLLGLEASSFQMLLTQTEEQEAAIRSKDIGKEAGMAVIGTIGRHARLAEALNAGQLLDWLRDNTALHKQLEQPIRTIAKHCGVKELIPLHKGSAASLRGLLRLWSHKQT